MPQNASPNYNIMVKRFRCPTFTSFGMDVLLNESRSEASRPRTGASTPGTRHPSRATSGLNPSSCSARRTGRGPCFPTS